MSKHDQEARKKQLRNSLYANQYRQRVCKKCKHRSCLPGSCKMCGAQAGERRFRK